MSEVTRYFTTGALLSCQATRKLYSHATDYVRASDYDATQSQLAALREELATSKRNEHNSEVAYKAAIEKQDELRDRKNSIVDLQQRLADAERRNSEREANLLKATAFVERLCASAGNQPSIATGYLRDILDTLNPNPEAASHDE